jgi:CheY-like chemotaxis protein
MDDGTERLTVLVVDDDPAVTRMLEAALRSLDVNVVTANAPFGVLNLVAEHRPRVVILDVMMPGLDGATLTQLIRQDEDIASTPILLYSAMDEAALADKARLCGADGHLPKTIGPARVVRELGLWISGSRSRPPSA